MLATRSFTATTDRGDRRLWAIALGLSLLVNAIAVIAVGLSTIQSAKFQQIRQVSAPPPPVETSITIFPDMIVAPEPTSDQAGLCADVCRPAHDATREAKVFWREKYASDKRPPPRRWRN